MKHLNTFEDTTYDLDFRMEEEDESNDSLENSLVDCIQSCQQILHSFSQKDKFQDLLKVVESTVDISQSLLNFLNREYGPIDTIKESSKKILQFTLKDINKYSENDIVHTCVENCKKIISLL